MSDDVVLIACDESGSEGENVTAAEHRLFVHGSVDLTVAEAQAVMDEVRRLAPSQAPEYKSDQILRPSAAGALRWLLSNVGPLTGRARAYLVDKDYFVVGKVVDLLVEEVTHAAGIDLYGDGQARELAWLLHRNGPRALPAAEWAELLTAFNSLMRARQRKGAKKTVNEFFETVDRVRLRSRRRDVDEVLAVLWKAKPHAEDFQEMLADAGDHLPALDPLVAALAQTIRAWAVDMSAAVHVVHDVQAVLTPPRVQALADGLARPGAEFLRFTPPVKLFGLDQVESKDDPRVQVADLLAGAAREIAGAALAGVADPRIALLRPFVERDSLWSDDPSWAVLTGRPGVGR